jgi:hypothetical protein
MPEYVLFYVLYFFRSGALEFEVLSYIDYNLSKLWTCGGFACYV